LKTTNHPTTAEADTPPIPGRNPAGEYHPFPQIRFAEESCAVALRCGEGCAWRYTLYYFFYAYICQKGVLMSTVKKKKCGAFGF
jgi:hypothetical protein